MQSQCGRGRGRGRRAPVRRRTRTYGGLGLEADVDHSVGAQLGSLVDEALRGEVAAARHHRRIGRHSEAAEGTQLHQQIEEDVGGHRARAEQHAVVAYDGHVGYRVVARDPLDGTASAARGRVVSKQGLSLSRARTHTRTTYAAPRDGTGAASARDTARVPPNHAAVSTASPTMATQHAYPRAPRHDARAVA